MVEDRLFGGIFAERRVLVTGHTGFKGSWLSLWLRLLGANVRGYSLEAQDSQNHFTLLSFPNSGVIGDLRDISRLENTFREFAPSIVFHLAAQAVVSESYRDPISTFETNILGTANVLEQCLRCSSVRCVVVVTSDKCYENDGADVPRCENHRLGGTDPYSVSKACAELVAKTYREQLSKMRRASNSTLSIATARAGNVIGGGDWAELRILPDIIRHIYGNSPLLIRHPLAVRPWQHVLDPLYGYLRLGEALLLGQGDLEGAWNFGPSDGAYVTVSEVLEIVRTLGYSLTPTSAETPSFYEHQLLKLDCRKSISGLSWSPVWSLSESIQRAMEWFESYYRRGQVISSDQIAAFSEDALRVGANEEKIRHEQKH